MLRAPRSHGDDMTHIPRFFRPGPWRAALLRCCLLGRPPLQRAEPAGPAPAAAAPRAVGSAAAWAGGLAAAAALVAGQPPSAGAAHEAEGEAFKAAGILLL